MYRFSRSIYRELAPSVVEDPYDPTGCQNKQQVLDSCEAAIRRLAYDHRYFARPARSLFNEVRMHFAINDQLRVWRVIEQNMTLALEYLSRLPEGVGLDGQPRHCSAHTRRGTPCQRQPLPGRDYCPSHKHLEETFESAELQLDAIEETSAERVELGAAA
jgi:hypothetical protein